MSRFFCSEKNKDVIIGNCTIIYPDVFYKLSYDEIMIWRSFTYKNLAVQRTFKVRDLVESKINEHETSIMNQMSGKINNFNELTLISYDSSYICSKDINIIKNIGNINENCVLVDTYVTMIECSYKMHNKDKFNFVNMDNIKKYLNIVTHNKKINNNKIKHFYKTGFKEANKFLYYCENMFYRSDKNLINNESKRFKRGIRNEINDDAILFILANLKGRFGFKNIVLYTFDKKMKDKCLDIGIETRS